MARKNDYICDLCGKNINEDAPHDFVLYLVAGNVNQRTVDVEEMDLPDHLKLLLSQKLPRLELCVGCVSAGEADLGPTAKGKMLGKLMAERGQAAARRVGGGDGKAFGKMKADELRAKFPGIEPIVPAEEW